MQINSVTFSYQRPLGYQQISATTLVASTGLNLPTPPVGRPIMAAVIQCNGGTVRWRDDGTNPTASIGMSLATGSELDYYGEMTAIKFIVSSGTPILDISYYG